jgi:hypothetical protein
MNTKRTIEGYIKLSGLTVSKFIKLMGWSRSTYHRRINDPDQITLGEFRRMDALVHFPNDAVLDMARKG